MKGERYKKVCVCAYFLFVIPAKAGIQILLNFMGVDFRWSLPSTAIRGGNDQNRTFAFISSPSIGEVRRGRGDASLLPPLPPPILGGEIRPKAKVLKRKKQYNLLTGFTLIELILYIGISAGVLLSFSLFMIHITGTRNKTFAVNEVQSSGRIAIDMITARIRDATGINTAASTFGTDPGVLSLRMDDVPARNPTIIRLSADNGSLQIQEGTGAPIQITNPFMRVTYLTFANLPPTDTKKNILIRLILKYDDPLAEEIITNSLWTPYDMPRVGSFSSDINPVELGIRFTSDTAGFIRGIRFYKGPTNTNTHTGRLWTNTGTLLGTATFTGETGSGWQEASFASPIPIAANTQYIASYHAPNGNYAADNFYFVTQGIDNPPLHAPVDNPLTGIRNGVFKYGSAGSFPDVTFQSLNYWVDVVFSTNGGFPAQGDVSFKYSQILETSVSLRQQTDISFWSPYDVPRVTALSDPSPIELGIRFTSDTAGFIRGIRFYKDLTNTGTHTGRLWTNTGTLLGTATFTGETGSGWQEASFASPIPIAANTQYIASYHAPNGNYAADNFYFVTQGIDNPPLHAPVDNPLTGIRNGVFKYGSAGSFPDVTFQSLNYWVDVVFSLTP